MDQKQPFLCLFIAILTSSIPGVSAQCPEGTFGRGCTLMCHCAAGIVCSSTGNCSMCETTWTGPTCQLSIGTDNVALNKTAYQQPRTKNAQGAELAVDGDFSTYSWAQDRNNTNGSVSWHVDLQTQHNIHAVKITFYDTDPPDTSILRRRPGFSVALSDIEDRELAASNPCYMDSSDWNMTTHVTLLPECNGMARYVYVLNQRNGINSFGNWSKLANLELEEVEVFEDQGCSDGTYGSECGEVCGHCTDVTCNRIDATCTGECFKGWYGATCMDECSINCLNTTCEQDGKCSLGCADGWYNDMCTDVCPLNCLDNKCETDGTCSLGCMDGWYTQTCDVPCFANCRENKCAADGTCALGCEDGWYGDTCTSPCNSNCADNKCEVTDGRCSNGCSDKQYHGDTCDVKCSLSIVDCASCEEDNGVVTCLDTVPCSDTCAICDTHCTQCKPGFFLTTNKDCISCSVYLQNCSECVTFNQCTKCMPGSYGSECKLCPEHCAECTSPTDCSSCRDRWQGSVCQCSANCNQSMGDAIADWCDVDGTCKQGCVLGKYSHNCEKDCAGKCEQCNQGDGKCLQCEAGFYGLLDQCTMMCGQCAGDVCDIDSGVCPGLCKPGYRGNYCNQTCPINCHPNTCNQSSAHCDSCADGYHGRQCELECNSNCVTEPFGTCLQATGYCYKCKTGYFGRMCERNCSVGCFLFDCLKGTGECFSKCVDGKYGLHCDLDCPDTCASMCHRDTGQCMGCAPQHYGAYCNMTCPSNCGTMFGQGNIECHQSTGHCSVCNMGYYGSKCDYSCSDNCALASIYNKPDCERQDGTCKRCVVGRYGEFCTEECSSHCTMAMCNQYTAHCDIGCLAGWYNDTCELACHVGCVDKECHRSTRKCLKGCLEGYSGITCEVVEKPAYTLFIVLAVVILLLLIAAAMLICFILRKRSRKGQRKAGGFALSVVRNGQAGEGQALLVNNSGNHTVSQPILPARNSKRSVLGEEDTFGGDEADMLVNHSDPSDYYNLSSLIPVAEFGEYLHKRRDEDLDWFKVEFKKLPTGLLKDVNDSKTIVNRGKCRYKQLYPYDWNRVKLEPESDAKHDFINASFIKGYKKPEAFIAAQGPTENTLNDFWRMIWQHDCGRIVMLTNLFEECKMKCVRYWPELEESDTYGVYQVVMVTEDVLPNYTIRHLQATHTGTKEMKDFQQYHYTTWPDRNVPDNPGFILSFKERVMADESGPSGPILVHCSAGIGRTGTFIALDYLVCQAHAENHIDVFRTVTDMRYQRTNFVQTDIQYGFLHTAICEALTTKDMEISSSDFCQYFWSLCEDDWQPLRDQFQSVNKNTPTIDSFMFAIGQLEENLCKNRHLDILPLDMHRAYLSTPVKGGNDYINAVFMPSCMNKTGFLLTQMPLPHTLTDFWRLVYDQHVCNIVMMNNLDDRDESIGEYWPSDDSVYGPFSVQLLSCEKREDFTILTIQLTHRSFSRETTMTVKLFQYEGWPDNESTPTTAKSLTSLISQVSRSSKDSSTEPVIVHCMDGSHRSGLYAVLSAVLERLQAEQKVNIPQVILQLRSRRPQIIPTFEQYIFVYNAVAEYIEATQIYSNVL